MDSIGEFVMQDEREVENAVNGLLQIYPEIQDSEVVIETSVSDSNEAGNVEQQLEPITRCPRCPYCKRVYASSGSLRRHVYAIHKMEYVEIKNQKGPIKCMYNTQCTASFARNLTYRQHLTHVHGVKIEEIAKDFNSMEEFLEWKDTEECHSQSQFNKFEKIYKSKEGTGDMRKRSYVCCRSGKCLVKGNKKRTMKIGTYCPARMDVLFNSERVLVKYFRTHVGHGSLDEIYKTSLKKRRQSTMRKKKRVYSALKLNVKAQVEQFLENLSQDKFPTKFLKRLSANLNSVFDPGVNPRHTSPTGDLKVNPVFEQTTENNYGIKSSERQHSTKDKGVMKTESFNNNLQDHGYVCRNNILSNRNSFVNSDSLAQPIVVHVSKENNESALNCKSKSNVDIKKKVVSLLPEQKSTAQNQVNYVINNGASAPAKQAMPFVILKTESGNILFNQRLQPNLNANNPAQNAGSILLQRRNNLVPLETGALNTKNSDNKLNLSAEEKKKFLETLWNTYKNS